MILRGVILAGGKGSRLGELTEATNKLLLRGYSTDAGALESLAHANQLVRSQVPEY